MQWQREEVLALAPDSASVKAAHKLTTANKWPVLGATATVALWGECQGSGKTPYRTAIDLTDIAFKCSCPSRKFPCKHALALFLLYVEADTPFVAAAPPDWVQGWLDKRTQRQQAQSASQSNPNAASATVPPPNGPSTNSNEKRSDKPNAQEKRAAARAQKVSAGVAELTLWLHDLVRNGFVDAQTRPFRYWQEMAARLIDAQAPGLASRVEALGTIVSAGDGWAEQMTVAVGKLYLLLEAYQRLETLPEPLQYDVRTLIGWHQSKEELVQSTPVPDQWRVLSHTLTQEETLISQRVWLRGETTGRFALILNFAHPSNRQSLDTVWRVDSTASATLYYYRSAVPLRAVATDVAIAPNHPANLQSTTNPATQSPNKYGTIAAALQQRRQWMAALPWLSNSPLLLGTVRVAVDQQSGSKQAFLCDQDSTLLPVSTKCKSLWLLLSISGGCPFDLFAEWLDDGVLPLGIWHEGQYWPL